MAGKKPLNLQLRRGRLTEFVLQTAGKDGFDSKGRIKITTLQDLKKKIEALPPTDDTESMLKAINFRLISRHWKHK